MCCVSLILWTWYCEYGCRNGCLPSTKTWSSQHTNIQGRLCPSWLETCCAAGWQWQAGCATGTRPAAQLLPEPWASHLLEIVDSTKDEDMSRLITNLKYINPLFYSHSTQSMYMVECIDYILKMNICHQCRQCGSWKLLSQTGCASKWELE